MTRPAVRKRIDFDRDAPRDGSTVVLIMLIDGEIEDMAEARFAGGSWQIDAAADFGWNAWSTPQERRRA